MTEGWKVKRRSKFRIVWENKKLKETIFISFEQIASNWQVVHVGQTRIIDRKFVPNKTLARRLAIRWMN